MLVPVGREVSLILGCFQKEEEEKRKEKRKHNNIICFYQAFRKQSWWKVSRKAFSDFFDIEILKSYSKAYTKCVEEVTYISSTKG